MKSEFPKNKLVNGLKSGKPKEKLKLDQGYMNSKYQEIQESNDRLKRLISKFNSDSEQRLTSLHESVICKAFAFQTKRDGSVQLKSRPIIKVASQKYNLDVIVEATGTVKPKVGGLPDKKKVEVERINRNANSIRGVKSKNFVVINKKDAFDPHCLSGRNAQNVQPQKAVEG